MDWRGKKEVEGETEEAWEEVRKRRRSQTSKGKPYTLKETRGLKLGLVSHKPMAMLQGEVEVQMNVEMQKERGADQGQIKLEMEKGEGSSLGESQGQDRGEGSASGENQGGDRNAEGSRSNDDEYTLCSMCNRGNPLCGNCYHANYGQECRGIPEKSITSRLFSCTPRSMSPPTWRSRSYLSSFDLLPSAFLSPP